MLGAQRCGSAPHFPNDASDASMASTMRRRPARVARRRWCESPAHATGRHRPSLVDAGSGSRLRPGRCGCRRSSRSAGQRGSSGEVCERPGRSPESTSSRRRADVVRNRSCRRSLGAAAKAPRRRRATGVSIVSAVSGTARRYRAVVHSMPSEHIAKDDGKGVIAQISVGRECRWMDCQFAVPNSRRGAPRRRATRRECQSCSAVQRIGNAVRTRSPSTSTNPKLAQQQQLAVGDEQAALAQFAERDALRGGEQKASVAISRITACGVRRAAMQKQCKDQWRGHAERCRR